MREFALLGDLSNVNARANKNVIIAHAKLNNKIIRKYFRFFQIDLDNSASSLS